MDHKHLSKLKYLSSFFFFLLAIEVLMPLQPSCGASTPSNLYLRVSGPVYTVENSYYRVEINQTSGGCITGVYSKEGSGKNLIELITAAAQESFGWGRVFYQAFDPYAKIIVRENNTNTVVLEVTAILESYYAGPSGITVRNILSFYADQPCFSINYGLFFTNSIDLLYLQVEAIVSRGSSLNESTLSINGSSPYIIPLLGSNVEYSNYTEVGYLWYDFHNKNEGIGFVVQKAEDFASYHGFSVWDDWKLRHKFIAKWEGRPIEVQEGTRYNGEIVYVVHGKNGKTTNLIASILAGTLKIEQVYAEFTEFKSSYQTLKETYDAALEEINRLQAEVKSLNDRVNNLVLLLVLCLISLVVVASLGIIYKIRTGERVSVKGTTFPTKLAKQFYHRGELRKPRHELENAYNGEDRYLWPSK